MTKSELITGGCAIKGIRQEERFRTLQHQALYGFLTHSISQLMSLNDLRDLDLCPITKVYLIPEITMPYNKLYMLVAFDFLPDRDNRQVFKCSEQYNTKSFPEKISLN